MSDDINPQRWQPTVWLSRHPHGWSWTWRPPADAPLTEPTAYGGTGHDTEDEAFRRACADLREWGWRGHIIGRRMCHCSGRPRPHMPRPGCGVVSP